MASVTDTPLVIGVTGLNAIENPGPGLSVIRSLREGFPNVRIIGLAYESLEPGIYLHNLVDKTYLIPYPSAGSDALLQRLQHIQAIEGMDIIIPNFDAELQNFIKISPELQKAGIRTVLPTHKQLEACSKPNLAAFGKQYGFSVPKTVSISTVDELQVAADELNYPLVVKGKFYEAEVTYTAYQAQNAFYRLSAKWGTPIIVQQFVKGTEINVAGLGDGKGNTLSIIPMRKLYITDKGKAWAGITIADDKLLDIAQQFTAATKWHGGFELELMQDKAGELFIMEINPRFPAWIYLTAAAGQNQPVALAKMALGEQVEPLTDYQVGKMFIRYALDHIADVSEFQHFSAFGELGP
ncbi:ATP-grasp domain-containing protein [Mucilaginibacter psychrotolerans]|uniref:ATP-grasp domain-containing protein n=1 Tax=Mucilaginibacter psychrotolerans TaxID=1524096 RepID=A0A4Y8S6F4_9SPHI|nr:ATP-grasp domain-containing protein [Mucilaginibacter psychrotolerans]TFF34502.1 ATP-grasp domain-containing protein [Mucilaginibacter psychrotolerans]